MPFSEFYTTKYTNGHRALGSVLSVFFSEDMDCTKASFTARCWGDSFRDWEGRNNMGGVFETHRTAAAVFKGTPGNSCVRSITDYASFQVFWHNCSNNTDLLTSMYFMNTPWIHGHSTQVLLYYSTWAQSMSPWSLIEGSDAVKSFRGGTILQQCGSYMLWLTFKNKLKSLVIFHSWMQKAKLFSHICHW